MRRGVVFELGALRRRAGFAAGDALGQRHAGDCERGDGGDEVAVRAGGEAGHEVEVGEAGGGEGEGCGGDGEGGHGALWVQIITW